MDFNSSGSLTTRYIWADRHRRRSTSGGTVSWYLADHLGTVRNIIDDFGGIIDTLISMHRDCACRDQPDEWRPRLAASAILERDTVTGLNGGVYGGERGNGTVGQPGPSGVQGRLSKRILVPGKWPERGFDPSGLKPWWARYLKSPDSECVAFGA